MALKEVPKENSGLPDGNYVPIAHSGISYIVPVALAQNNQYYLNFKFKR